MTRANVRRCFVFSLLFLTVGLHICLGEEPIHKEWQIGDTWKVRTWLAISKHTARENYTIRKGKAIDVEFEVVGEKSLADFATPYLPIEIPERAKYKKKIRDGIIKESEIRCFEIRVLFPEEETGFRQRYLLYFRKDTGSLIRVLNNSLRDDGSIINQVTDCPIDPNEPAITGEIGSLVPFDWAVFGRKELKHEKEGFSLEQEVKEKKVKDAEGKEYSEYDVVISKKVKKGEEEVELERCEQKWRKGDPWWSEAKRYKDGELITEAVLVRE